MQNRHILIHYATPCGKCLIDKEFVLHHVSDLHRVLKIKKIVTNTDFGARYELDFA